MRYYLSNSAEKVYSSIKETIANQNQSLNITMNALNNIIELSNTANKVVFSHHKNLNSKLLFKQKW